MLIKKIEKLIRKQLFIYERIKELEFTIGMSIDEYKELHKLYDEYYEVTQKIKKLKKYIG